MKEVDVESADDLNEEAVDVLQRFIVGFQSLNKLRRGVNPFFGKHST